MKMLTRIIVFLAAVAAIVIFGASLASAAPARSAQIGKHHHATVTISAKRHARRHHSRHVGACDGFQRCRCGTTAARRHGLPYNYNGYNLKQASEWARAFPRSSFHVGAVGVRPHHVLTIVGGADCRSATVYDDAGTYQRNVCGMRFVSVSGGAFSLTASALIGDKHTTR